MPKRIAQDWQELERDLHAAGVSPEEIESDAHAVLAQAQGQQAERLVPRFSSLHLADHERLDPSRGLTCSPARGLVTDIRGRCRGAPQEVS